MRLHSLLALSAAALPFSAPAQVISECGWVASPANIAEPWSEFSRTYANGAIRIALLDTEEPTCCSFFLLILSPSGVVEGPGYRACNVLSLGETLGFNGIDFAAITASYDPARGLVLSVPASLWHEGMPPDGSPDPLTVTARVRINQATGAVTLEPADK